MFWSDTDPAVYAACGFGGGLYLFYKGFQTFREYRVVENTPEAPIRSIAMGLVRVHGQARGDDLIYSPVSHTPCLFYNVEIERWHSDKDGGHWSGYRTDSDGVKFYLHDRSGRVLIDAHHAEYDLVQNTRRELGSWKSGSAAGGASESELRSYITGVTLKKLSWFVERRLNPERPDFAVQQVKARQAAVDMFNCPVGSPEFLEHTLAALSPELPQRLTELGPQGDPVKEQARLAVLEAYKSPVGSPEFRENMRRALGAELPATPLAAINPASLPTDSKCPYSTCAPTSGRFRFTEYCIVPEHLYDVTGTCTENPSPCDDHDRNLILKGANEPTFLISFRSAQEVEKVLEHRAAWQIFGGAGLSIVCLIYLLARFDLF